MDKKERQVMATREYVRQLTREKFDADLYEEAVNEISEAFGQPRGWFQDYVFHARSSNDTTSVLNVLNAVLPENGIRYYGYALFKELEGATEEKPSWKKRDKWAIAAIISMILTAVGILWRACYGY